MCIEHITLFYSFIHLLTEMSCVIEIKSVDLCWLTLITFKCNCVFLLIDEKCLGLLFIYFDSTELTLIWNQFALLKSLWWVALADLVLRL